MLIHDEDTVRGMEVLQSGAHVLVDRLGVPGERSPAQLAGASLAQAASATSWGRSRPPSIWAWGRKTTSSPSPPTPMIAIPSVSQALYGRNDGRPDDDQLEMWAKSVFLGASLGEIVDLTKAGQQQRLHQMKARPVDASSATAKPTSARWPTSRSGMGSMPRSRRSTR
jgi:cysteine synthase A